MLRPISFLFLFSSVNCSPVPTESDEAQRERVIEVFFNNTKRLTQYPVIFDNIYCQPDTISRLISYYDAVIKKYEVEMMLASMVTEMAWDVYLDICSSLCDHVKEVLKADEECVSETKFEKIPGSRNLTLREVNPQILEIAEFWRSMDEFIITATEVRLESHVRKLQFYPEPCLTQFLENSRKKILEIRHLPAAYYNELWSTYFEIESGSMYDQQDIKLRHSSGNSLLFTFANQCCDALIAEDARDIGFVDTKRLANDCSAKAETPEWLKKLVKMLILF